MGRGATARELHLALLREQRSEAGGLHAHGPDVPERPGRGARQHASPHQGRRGLQLRRGGRTCLRWRGGCRRARQRLARSDALLLLGALPQEFLYSVAHFVGFSEQRCTSGVSELGVGASTCRGEVWARSGRGGRVYGWIRVVLVLALLGSSVSARCPRAGDAELGEHIQRTKLGSKSGTILPIASTVKSTVPEVSAHPRPQNLLQVAVHNR